MSELFEYVWHRDKEAEFKEKAKKVDEEKDLKEDDFKRILREFLKDKKLLTAEERSNHYNDNPFDFIIGIEKDLHLCGIEIKGDTDNFTRLKDQMRAYNFIFNEVYLALHKKDAPEWLPDGVGVLRVFEDGTIFIEKQSYIRDVLDISTDYEWETIFSCNGLGTTSKQTREILKILKDIRRNILFNRFFAVSSGYAQKNYSKFYPLTEEQKAVIMGFDIPYHYKKFEKDIIQIEKRLETVKRVAQLGVASILEENGRKIKRTIQKKVTK